MEINSLETTKEDVLNIVSKYQKQLSENGISIAVSKRYFEKKVYEYHHSRHHNAIAAFFCIEMLLYHRKREKIYKSQPNRYYCISLCVSPTNKSVLKNNLCREYAFMVSKIERLYKGLKPKYVVYNKEKVIAKIENRIQKLLRSASKYTPEKACRDNIFDVLRYVYNVEYYYKKQSMGKSLVWWEHVMEACLAVVALVAFICACILILI